ncbi:spermidine hydroxycinnamoyl transferase-like [Neltuma alba]|uniref:spermidine hydroxycinnamoyl transferase-like n=1 Tax=Neltuma alba TaxID=207710 RepID=UPI0010A531B2|nr:spermidine hydroxycinnamoyl transferase-like [Prosopis alba]
MECGKMVCVRSSYTVVPSEPTPTGIFPLSLCDQIKLSSHGPVLLVHKPNFTSTSSHSDSSPIHVLRTSLGRALVHYYPLSARLCWIHGGRWQLHCFAQGALLLEATCEANLDDLRDFAPTEIVEQLMPKIDYNRPIQDIPLLAVQLTRFSCGGLTLGVALCRAVNDGSAVSGFLNSWAKLARGGKLDLGETPFLDRTLLDSWRLKTEPRFVHTEFHPAPIWTGRLADTKYEAKAAIFKLNKVQVQKLKSKAREFGTSQRPYTSFEVITGHLWRCVSRARYVGNGDQPTRLSTLVNCRNRLNPPLRNDYFGNATFPTVSPTCSFDDLIYKPLTYAVRNVKEAVEKMNDEYIRSALDYIASQKDLDLVRNTFHAGTVSPEGEFKGNPNLFVVGWFNFPFYGTDFGWGKPFHMGPGQLNSDGKAFLMNDRNSDGFVLAICLQSSHLDALKNLFYQDIEEQFVPSSKL